MTLLVCVASLGARREASAKAYRYAYPLGRSLAACEAQNTELGKQQGRNTFDF